MCRGKRRSGPIIQFIPVAALTLAIAGCSSAGGDGSSFQRAVSAVRWRVVRRRRPRRPPTTGASTNLDTCPNVDVRRGAGTITVNTNARDPSAMQLRYQISVGQMARECVNVAGNLNMKVGMQGRVVLGPAGTSGTIEIPVRYALVEEGPQPKTVYSQLHRVPVVIGEGQHERIVHAYR